MEIKFNNDWDNILNELLNKTATKQLFNFIKKERKENNVFPKKSKVFKAFELCSFENTKIVIIGQDPYHKINQANGLAFSVPNTQKLPPSLKNIFKELNNDMLIKMSNKGNLNNWAKQGVLLLNCIMTVRENEPGSHIKLGWEDFTDSVIKILSKKKKHVIFLLWGNYAKKKTKDD